jgi:Ca2+-binding EF-hand superfamily protein
LLLPACRIVAPQGRRYRHRWFTELDTDTSGTLDTMKIVELLRRLGDGIGNSSLKAVMTVLDSDKNGNVSKLEFDVWYREPLKGTGLTQNSQVGPAV